MPIRSSSLALLSLLLFASPAQAAQKSFHVTGEVFSRSEVLAPYGVENGSVVTIDWTVELTTPPSAQQGPPDNTTHYLDAITWIEIHIGDWLAIKAAPPGTHNLVSVADDSGESAAVDTWHLTTHATDNDLVLHTNLPGGLLLLSLDFYAIFGGASSNQGLDQDPSKYDNGVGSALGPGGGVYFTIDTDGSGSGGGSGPVDPTASCRKSQLAAASKLCKAELKCHAGYAKNPAGDPVSEKLGACLAKAEEKFVLAYDKAAAKAQDKGLACGTSAPASEPLAEITGQIDEIVAGVAAIEPTHPPLESAWLAAASGACGSALKAEAANAAKPDPDKLAAARAKASEKLFNAAEYAAANAAYQGIVFAPPLDIAGFHDSVEAAIEAAVAVINGD